MNYADEYSSGKVIVTNDHIKFVRYKIPYKSGAREHEIKKVNFNNPDFEKQDKNLFRAQAKVEEIINANVLEHSKFLTLTTADTVLDEKAFRRRLQTFIQAMSREGFKLRYLGVLERQKKRGAKEGNSGSIHAHLIIFNDEFIPFDIINKHWKGKTDIHILNGLKYDTGEKIENVARYVCKYITKDNLNDFNKHVYFCSKGLQRPAEFNIPVYKLSDDTYCYDNEDERIQAYKQLLSQCDIYEKSEMISLLPFDKTKTQIKTIKKGKMKYE